MSFVIPRVRPLSAAVMALATIFVQTAIGQQDGIQLTYCSSQNTGSDQSPVNWTWQSNGYCFTQCKGQYAFGIVQGNDCWCSNYAPADHSAIDDCDRTCPGYPTERCGSKDGKLFGYVALERNPSGTVGNPQPTSESSSRTSTPTTLEKSTSEPPPPARTTDVIVITQSGATTTKTVAYVPNVPSDTSPPASTSKQSSSTGPIVGGVVGGVAGVAAIAGAILFLLRRRHAQQANAEQDSDPSGVSRNVSTMSKSGLLRVSEKNPKYPPPITTANTNRSSRVMTSESISPVSASDRRSSRPYVFDQRLNPSAIMNFDNTSRGSFASMEDSRDYGRTLNVRNPDPDPDSDLR